MVNTLREVANKQIQFAPSATKRKSLGKESYAVRKLKYNKQEESYFTLLWVKKYQLVVAADQKTVQ